VSFDKEIIMEYQYDHILLEGSFSLLNALWNGNTAYIKINDHYYWMDQHNWAEEESSKQKQNLCEDPEVLSEKWTTPIRIVYRKPKTSYNNIKISLGYKFQPENNLTNKQFKNCKLSDLSSLKEIINFSEMYISIK